MAIYDENGVPILQLSNSSQEYVDGKHAAAQRALEDAAHAVADASNSDELEAAAEKQAEVIAKHLLHGESIVIHNKAPITATTRNADGTITVHPDAPEYTHVGIGASDLDEALKDAIGAFDGGGDPDGGHVRNNDREHRPDWVASTHEDLARLLAEHYNGGKADGPCQPRELSEVL